MLGCCLIIVEHYGTSPFGRMMIMNLGKAGIKEIIRTRLKRKQHF
jgi:hypothetical protein